MTSQRTEDRVGSVATGPARLRQWLTGPRMVRGRRLLGLVALCGYCATLGLASLERVPLPTSLGGVNRAAGEAAALLRQVSVIPGPALFYDRDDTPIGILTNCVVVTAVSADGDESLAYATSTCGNEADAALLAGPVDKALVRLQFDALVFSAVPATGSPTSGDRILAAIGHHHCRMADGSAVAEVGVLWAQAVEDRRDQSRHWVTRSLARWSCQDRQLLEAEWFPLVVDPPT